MRERLIAAELWDSRNPGDPSQSILAAWQVVSRLGAACRYSGMSPDGQKEFLILEPRTGALLACGRGRSTPEALCMAALAAREKGAHAG
jgi:hypothetical protein